MERDYWFGSRLIYRWTTTGAGPVMHDRLGSARADAGTGSAVYSGFYPYGEEKGAATANDRVKFGTYRRDGDTGLDYAEQRYYSSAMGRFLRPDPFGGSADVGNPQSWNRYSYALNDPARWNDPTGMDAVTCTMPDGIGGQADCSELDVAYQQYGSNMADLPCSMIDGGTALGLCATSDQSWADQLAPTTVGTTVGEAISNTLGQILSTVLGPVILIVANPVPTGGKWGDTYPTVQQVQTECQPVGPLVVVPSTGRRNRGGTSVEQEYICPDGMPYTIHILRDRNGRIRDIHVRPGRPRYGKSLAIQ